MPQASHSRRGFLRSAAALAAGGACASLASTAQAITARPASDYGAVLESACGPVGEHARLIEETEAALGRPRTDPLVQAVLQRTACPACGCPLLAAPVNSGRLPF